MGYLDDHFGPTSKGSDHADHYKKVRPELFPDGGYHVRPTEQDSETTGEQAVAAENVDEQMEQTREEIKPVLR